MNPHERVRSAFVYFHIVLGVVLLIGSVQTVLGIGQQDSHALILGSVESVAAILFLIPRTVRLGALLLLSVLAAAFLIHLHRGEWPGGLLIYAAGVAFVAVHGGAYRGRPAWT